MPAPQQWMSTAKLRALYDAGQTYDEIAEANFRMTGFRPTRSGVRKKFDRLGFGPRKLSHSDLVPWLLRPEHAQDRMRYMLQAESARRAGKTLTPDDTRKVSLLNDMLFGRGALMVVSYDPAIGFHLVDRNDADTDIIRQPSEMRKRAAHDGRTGLDGYGEMPAGLENLFELAPHEVAKVVRFVETMRNVSRDRRGVADACGA